MAPRRFPTIPDDEMQQLLAPPRAPIRVVIDTDARNEIDDQYALTWALLSRDVLELEAVYAAPFSYRDQQDELVRTFELLSASAAGATELGPSARYASWARSLMAAGMHPRDLPLHGPDVGMHRSYEEICVIFAKLGLSPHGRVFRGADRYLGATPDPVPSPAVEDLVARASRRDGRPLYVVAIGCATNVASALLLHPQIIRDIVVVWTAGYPTAVDLPNYSFNLEQDVRASQLLFDSGVPHVYLPGFYVGAQLQLSLPDAEAWVRGRGAIGDYLYELYTDNPLYALRGIRDHWGRAKVLWDLINIAWLINPDWVPSRLGRSPVLRDDLTWDRGAPGRHLMREAYEVDRNAIFRDFLARLDRQA
jgi:inosine-uridine preferring nucleoside hydrolase